ncbi:MAG: futalosine hydrolase [Salibacteraceae bacterium]
MRFLLVAATRLEIDPLLSALRAKDKTDSNKQLHFLYEHLEIDVLITGVGMTATAYWMARAMALKKYDVAVNLGLAGTFHRNLELGTPVWVVKDRFAEMGAEAGDQFLPITQMKLLSSQDHPSTDSTVTLEAPITAPILGKMPKVSGITVNTVHGNEISIERVRNQFRPIVESMEGAAFMYACLAAEVPGYQLRTISNYVEKRNRESWDLVKAVKMLNDLGFTLLTEWGKQKP